MAYKPGQSGNPGGRPRDALRDALKEYKGLPDKLISVVVGILDSPEVKPSDRLAAASFIADRLYGKPVQTQDITVTQPEPLFMLDEEPEILSKTETAH